MESWVMCAGCVWDAWIGTYLCVCTGVDMDKVMWKDKGMSIGDTNTVQPEHKTAAHKISVWVGFRWLSSTPSYPLPFCCSALSPHTTYLQHHPPRPLPCPATLPILPYLPSLVLFLCFSVSLFHFPNAKSLLLYQGIRSLFLPFSVFETDVCGDLQILIPLESSPQSVLNQVSGWRGNFRSGITQADGLGPCIHEFRALNCSALSLTAAMVLFSHLPPAPGLKVFTLGARILPHFLGSHPRCRNSKEWKQVSHKPRLGWNCYPALSHGSQWRLNTQTWVPLFCGTVSTLINHWWFQIFLVSQFLAGVNLYLTLTSPNCYLNENRDFLSFHFHLIPPRYWL